MTRALTWVLIWILTCDSTLLDLPGPAAKRLCFGFVWLRCLVSFYLAWTLTPRNPSNYTPPHKGFYINATVDKWRNWRMYDYVTQVGGCALLLWSCAVELCRAVSVQSCHWPPSSARHSFANPNSRPPPPTPKRNQELPALLAAHFPQLDTANASIMGHSMVGSPGFLLHTCAVVRGCCRGRVLMSHPQSMHVSSRVCAPNKWNGTLPEANTTSDAPPLVQRPPHHARCTQHACPRANPNPAIPPKPNSIQGGHGALTIALKNPGVFKAVSAFAPICNPVNVPWGQKAFAGYLGRRGRAKP